MATKTIKLHHYDCIVNIVITSNIENTLSKLFKKHKDKYKHFPIEGMMYSPNLNQYYIVLDEKFLSHNLIAHELHHCVCSIGRDRDIKDEENRCWLAGFLTEETYKLVEKKKLKLVNGNRTK